MTTVPQEPAPQRRFSRNSFSLRRFGLRTLLIVVTLCAIGVAWWVTRIEPYRREAQLAEELRQAGAKVEAEPAETWVKKLLGEENLQIIRVANLRELEITPQRLNQLESLVGVEQLYLRGDSLSAEDIRRLAALPGLQVLVVDSAVVDERVLGFSEKRTSERKAFFTDRFARQQLKALNVYGASGSSTNPIATAADAMLLMPTKTVKNYKLLLNLLEAEAGDAITMHAPATDDNAGEEIAYWLRRLRGMKSVVVHGETGSQRICASVSMWPELESVVIEKANSADEFGLKALQESATLRFLTLRDVTLPPADYQAIGGLSQLTRLDISDANLGDAEMAALSVLRKLEHLYLLETKLTPAGATELAKIQSLRSLEISAGVLMLENCTLLSSLPALEQLKIDGAISTTLKAALKQALPECLVIAKTQSR